MEEHNCRHLLGSLSEYVDGEACAEICAEIEQHLSSCENCRVVVDSLRKTVSLYQSEQEPGMPDAVRQRLFHCLNLDDFLEKKA
ncbi:MAG: anti-sigma factor family protein [Chloroflexota bacterium]